MDNYKLASKVNLKFPTELTKVGELSVAEVWNMNFPQLTNAIKSAHKLLKKSETVDSELEFLSATSTTTVADTMNTLRFEILKDIYTTKKEEYDTAKSAAAKKLHNDKIKSLIADKEEDSLNNMSIDELKALIQE